MKSHIIHCNERASRGVWFFSMVTCAPSGRGVRLILMEKTNLTERIKIDPAICHGKPTIRRLRYPVEMIDELLSAKMTIEEILADYEDLEREDILAVLNYTKTIKI